MTATGIVVGTVTVTDPKLCSKLEWYSTGSGQERQLLRIRYLVRVPWTSGWERGRVRSRDSADSTSMYSLQNKDKIIRNS
jgi:hypothetical protein